MSEDLTRSLIELLADSTSFLLPLRTCPPSPLLLPPLFLFSLPLSPSSPRPGPANHHTRITTLERSRSSSLSRSTLELLQLRNSSLDEVSSRTFRLTPLLPLPLPPLLATTLTSFVFSSTTKLPLTDFERKLAIEQAQLKRDDLELCDSLSKPALARQEKIREAEEHKQYTDFMARSKQYRAESEVRQRRWEDEQRERDRRSAERKRKYAAWIVEWDQFREEMAKKGIYLDI